MVYMKITFREYKNKDKQLLLGLSNKLAAHSKQIDPLKRVLNLPGFVEIDVAEMLENVQKYRGKIWFAEHERNVVGYIIGAIWVQSDKNKLEIGSHILGEVLDLYLNEKYREKGIGSKMLAMMESYFKKNSCDSMWTQVFALNHPAHNLYKKHGFADREIGMLKNI